MQTYRYNMLRVTTMSMTNKRDLWFLRSMQLYYRLCRNYARQIFVAVQSSILEKNDQRSLLYRLIKETAMANGVNRGLYTRKSFCNSLKQLQTQRDLTLSWNNSWICKKHNRKLSVPDDSLTSTKPLENST